MTFDYTSANTEIDSSLVYEAYYDNNGQKLAVVLDGGYGYVYDNVPAWVFYQLTGANSPGGVYNKTVKHNYGPGTSLGYVGYDNDLVFNHGVPAPTLPRPHRLGTPKGLTLAPDVVDSSPDVLVPLFSTTEDSVAYKHTVNFTVDGGNDVKTYSVDVGDVTEAIKAVTEIGDMLGLAFKIRSVEVFFSE